MNASLECVQNLIERNIFPKFSFKFIHNFSAILLTNRQTYTNGGENNTRTSPHKCRRSYDK